MSSSVSSTEGPVIEELTLTNAGEYVEDLAGDNTKRVWLVRYTADTRPATLRQVKIDVGVEVSDYYTDDEDETLRAKKITVRPAGTSTKLEYVVEATYEQPSKSNINWIPNPLLRPDEISLQSESETETIFISEDDTPKAIVNSANEAFQELQTRTTCSFRLVIEGNRATINPSSWAALLRPNHVNSSSFTVRGVTVAERTGKFVGIGSTEQSENGVNYHRLRWEIAIAPDWQLHLADIGFNELDDEDVPTPIVKGDPAAQVQTPWPLDGDGAAKPNAYDTPETLDFKAYPEANFNIFDWTA